MKICRNKTEFIFFGGWLMLRLGELGWMEAKCVIFYIHTFYKENKKSNPYKSLTETWKYDGGRLRKSNTRKKKNMKQELTKTMAKDLR